MRYANLLVREYDRLGHDVRPSLRKGLSKRLLLKALRSFLKLPHPVSHPIFPQSLPASLIELYGWHNGGGELIAHMDFLTFDQALAYWDITSESAEDSVMYENGNVVFADTSPFPFMRTGGGEYIVMDVGASSATRGSVGYYDKTGVSTVRNEFATLSKFFRAHYQCCKDGRYSVADGQLHYQRDRSETLDRFRARNLQIAEGGILLN